MPFFSYLDEYSDITDITFRDRKRFASLDKFSHQILRGKSSLSVSQREIIAAYVSGLNECNFCQGIHTEVAKNFGIDERLIVDLITNIDQADVSPEFLQLLKYIKKLTLSPSKIVEEDAQAVFAAGWSEKGLQDAICVGALFNFYNRLLDGHGIKGDKNMYELGAVHLTKRGYSVPWFIRYIRKFIRESRVKKLKG
ncbi:peroxidase [Neolewinella aurantiaca]|uniref:Peroxidase n=1 Tax=Neolewinella aurantiaca TaxID=2602767 RepID=A0A5C7FU50_9BACT|nr:carboxymuconolactone decarboxylase family protein [Neolewinella aurantiaca]TXF89812.1 peroxidase [Neolewinella aurantiaca]